MLLPHGFLGNPLTFWARGTYSAKQDGARRSASHGLSGVLFSWTATGANGTRELESADESAQSRELSGSALVFTL
jgi:hypothetical protein